ncbi:hypothetical protein D046_2446B, partial [Vibrio parahaemolyticus V-223/04]
RRILTCTMRKKCSQNR